MKKIEREVKVINVDPKNIIQQLNAMNAEYLGEKFQQIYTYEITPLSQRITKLLELMTVYDVPASEMKEQVDDLLQELNFLLSEDDEKQLDNLCREQNIPSWKFLCENIQGYNYHSLLESAHHIFSKYVKNENKWGRLRRTTINSKEERVTLAVKHIAEKRSEQKIREYMIDSLREIEIKIDSFESGKILLESMGYYYRNYQEKKRLSYQYHNIRIDIDMWPLIPPYLEIESDSTEDIYAFLDKLKVDRDTVKVMSPDDIFSYYDIDLLALRKLAF